MARAPLTDRRNPFLAGDGAVELRRVPSSPAALASMRAWAAWRLCSSSPSCSGTAADVLDHLLTVTLDALQVGGAVARIGGVVRRLQERIGVIRVDVRLNGIVLRRLTVLVEVCLGGPYGGLLGVELRRRSAISAWPRGLLVEIVATCVEADQLCRDVLGLVLELPDGLRGSAATDGAKVSATTQRRVSRAGGR